MGANAPLRAPIRALLLAIQESAASANQSSHCLASAAQSHSQSAAVTWHPMVANSSKLVLLLVALHSRAGTLYICAKRLVTIPKFHPMNHASSLLMPCVTVTKPRSRSSVATPRCLVVSKFVNLNMLVDALANLDVMMHHPHPRPLTRFCALRVCLDKHRFKLLHY